LTHVIYPDGLNLIIICKKAVETWTLCAQQTKLYLPHECMQGIPCIILCLPKSADFTRETYFMIPEFIFKKGKCSIIHNAYWLNGNNILYYIAGLWWNHAHDRCCTLLHYLITHTPFHPVRYSNMVEWTNYWMTALQWWDSNAKLHDDKWSTPTICAK
jgi:hypothetical protein